MQELHSCTHSTCTDDTSSDHSVVHGQKNSISSCSASHWQSLGPYAPFLGQRQEATYFQKTRSAFALTLVFALRLWCLYRLHCACPWALLSQKVGTNFHTLKTEHRQNRITFAALCWVVIWSLWKTRLGMDTMLTCLHRGFPAVVSEVWQWGPVQCVDGEEILWEGRMRSAFLRQLNLSHECWWQWSLLLWPFTNREMC